MIEELYNTCYEELVHFGQGMCGDRYIAEELVQEAFLRAMLHEALLAELNEPQRKSWLYRTVKNTYIDHVRHASFEQITQDFPESVNIPAEYTNLEWQELLTALPDIEGVLFSLRYLQDYNSTQLSEMFHMPSGTIRSKLSSARKHLKNLMEDKNHV